MRTIQSFYARAERAFRELSLGGKFRGIQVRGEEVFFVHGFPEGSILETLWEDGPAHWETAYRDVRAIGTTH